MALTVEKTPDELRAETLETWEKMKKETNPEEKEKLWEKVRTLNYFWNQSLGIQ